MKDRLLKFLNKEQLSSARFAEIIGVQPSSISHILSGRNKPGFDFIQKILSSYPSINAEWLIMGKGNMLKSQNLQGDLFSAGYDGDKYRSPIAGKDEKTLLEEETLPETENETEIADTNVNSFASSEDYKSNSNKFSAVTSVNNDKLIEKIVILYSDKSFKEYSPE